MTLIISATPADLRIETRRASKDKGGVSSETLNFRLDGSENVIADNSGVPLKTKARLDGAKLVTK